MRKKSSARKRVPPPGEPWSMRPELIPLCFAEADDFDAPELKRQAEEEWAHRCCVCDAPAVYYATRDEHWRNGRVVPTATPICETHAAEYARSHGIPLPLPTLRVGREAP